MPRRTSVIKSVSVRAYRAKDISSCRRLWEELTIRHREIYADPSIGGENPGLFFDDHLKRVGARNLWVAECGSEVVGLVGLVVEGEDAEIEPLVVTRKHRGKGIGTMLAATAAEKAARSKGVKYLTVRPVARNVEALRFFSGIGLVNVGRIELFKDFRGKKWKEGLKIHGLDLGY